MARRNGDVSFWQSSLEPLRPRASLPGSIGADVAIAGAGFTGLWAAYYLKRVRPDLEIVVVDREFAGFGASGRNGGWLSDHFATPREAMAKTHGREAVRALQQQMRAAIDEVIDVCRREAIDADIVKHGNLTVARSPAQARRLATAVATDRAWGVTQADLVELGPEALSHRVRVAASEFATWSPHCARIQPAKLVRGLAAAVERLGVTIYESTTVQSIDPRAMLTDRGRIEAATILSCLEGYTASLKGERRTWLPLNSAIAVTDPLPDRVWDEIGWDGAELLGDCAHAYCYMQRTADGRIAMGGRGMPYRWRSRTDVRGATQPATIRQLVRHLHAVFPSTRDVPIAHAWCGVLGVPRDWSSTVRFDPRTGLGIAGGYVGNGVTTANLAGRTLADLVLERETALTKLPWVGHRARSWEPEPVRWLGVRLVYALSRAADRREDRHRKAPDSRLATVANALAGR